MDDLWAGPGNVRCVMESTTTRATSQELWGEVWRQVGHHIADYCSTIDWVKASGASLEVSKVIILRDLTQLDLICYLEITCT